MILNQKNISFVIPSFNSESTLSKTIDSIFDTNFKVGDEVIIVEDCSTDKTLLVAKNLSDKYSPNIRIIKNIENKGCPASRNVGIREAKNDYIFSFDSDNIMSKNSVQNLKDKLTETGADIATFGEVHFFINDHRKITHKWIFKKGWFTLSDLFSGNLNPAPIGNYLFKKESWEKTNRFSELKKGLHEAWIFTFNQLLSGSKIYISDEGFYYHKYGHESLTIREYRKNNVEMTILNTALDGHMDIFTENDSKYIKENTPAWIHNLNKRPINLNSSKVGKNGKLHRMVYGIYRSVLKRIMGHENTN